ncbi:acyl carrier protein [Paraburkholderia sp. USG1]|uniref:acyl carrier protein n=1 Tax=Paraburkholderia sp. USG1 TaxID=2952268 RepID=UPI0028660D52|nr:acyl carrier protein [Paraburkholderia sp. USG1]MDR8402041.1 acyl carrier protein [Paraburkholderia sp. USG1]
MLLLPDTIVPLQAGALSPVSPAAGASADGAGAGVSPLERLLASAQDRQDTSTRRLSQHLDQFGASHISTEDMLRLQVDLNAFEVQTQMMTHVADDIGRAIQTLTQRS